MGASGADADDDAGILSRPAADVGVADLRRGIRWLWIFFAEDSVRGPLRCQRVRDRRADSVRLLLSDLGRPADHGPAVTVSGEHANDARRDLLGRGQSASQCDLSLFAVALFHDAGMVQGGVNIPVSDTFALRIAGFGAARGSFYSITDTDPPRFATSRVSERLRRSHAS